MKFLVKTLRQHFREDFSLTAFIAMLLFAGLLIVLNSLFSAEQFVTQKFSYRYWIYPIETGKNLLVYWSSVALLHALGTVKIREWRRFLLLGSLAILIYSIYSVFYGYICVVLHSPAPCRIWLHYVSENISGLITLGLPMFLIYRLWQKNELKSFYGLHLNQIVWTRYLDVILLIVAVMYGAMYLPGIQEYYPILDSSYFRVCADYLDVPRWLTAIGFELSYLIDFVWIELFFRGVLVIGMVRYLGKHAILPMAVLYVVIHFGKPLPEIISSFFGGYILGVVAYHTQNIRAGIILHVVLAFSAELFGYLLLD
ncbi:MAG: CPBP family intramembrane metalloprotease [Bacteroidales bacterium]|nr:CPBP family intramembrane metalloprotease [Bacteroidales bacterium]